MSLSALQQQLGNTDDALKTLSQGEDSNTQCVGTCTKPILGQDCCEIYITSCAAINSDYEPGKQISK